MVDFEGHPSLAINPILVMIPDSTYLVHGPGGVTVHPTKNPPR